MNYLIILIISIAITISLITILVFCGHLVLAKAISKQISKLRFSKKAEKKELVERITKKRGKKNTNVADIQLQGLEHVEINKNIREINKIDESIAPSAAYMSRRKRSSSLVSGDVLNLQNQFKNLNYSVSSSESCLTESDSEVSSVNDQETRKEEINRRKKQLLQVLSETKDSISEEDETSVNKKSIFNNLFSKPQSSTKDDSVNFRIPRRFEKTNSNVRKTSMVAFSININEIDRGEYGLEFDNKAMLSSKAVNLYDKRKRSIFSPQTDFNLELNEDSNQVADSSFTKLKFSIFNDKPMNLIKFHLISIIDSKYICKHLDESEVENTETHSKMSSKILFKKNKNLKISEFYLKLNFEVYNSLEDTNKIGIPQHQISARRRFSDAFMDKLHIKNANNRKNKVLENQTMYKSRIIKFTNENRSIPIDQVFTYTNLIKFNENKENLNSVNENEEDENQPNNSYLDLFRTFKSKFFIVKISLHEALTKKKLGKLEVFLDFMNLNLNPFNTFTSELIPINTENDDKDNLLDAVVLTPKFCEKIQKSCELELLVGLQCISSELICIKISKFRAQCLMNILSSLKKCYCFCKISMYVSRKLIKKKNTKFHKILSNDQIETQKDASATSTAVISKIDTFDLNERLSFDFVMNKFDQIYFNIDLYITASKKGEAKNLGKIIIGSINYCKNIKGFTQMEQMIRDSGNEITEWHKFT